MSSLELDAHAVLLPAFAALDLDRDVVAFLKAGGTSILLGESRDEYVARAMSADRQASETADAMRAVVRRASDLAGAVLVCVDQELGGIQRLQGLGAKPMSLAEAMDLGEAELQERCADLGRLAKSLGVNLVLAPILDVVTGPNAWLDGRTLGPDAHEVARIGAAFIKGVQSAGVVATAKHFPGYPTLDADPAVDDTTYTGAVLETSLLPFRAAIAAGVRAVMTGPAAISALGGSTPASLSAAVMRSLRDELGFGGLIISDDLDAKATLRGRVLEDVAVEALEAGAELLLIGAGPHLEHVASAIVRAVGEGRLAADKLAAAATKVRALAVEAQAGTIGRT